MSKNNKKIDINWQAFLEREYEVCGKSTIVISKEYGYGKTTILRKLHELNFRVRGTAEGLRGKSRTREYKDKLSKALKGKNTWMKGRKLPFSVRQKISRSKIGEKKSVETRQRMSRSKIGMKFTPEHRANISKCKIGKYTGSASHFWKGGKTSEKMLLRRSAKYNNWRLQVFNRDGFKCVSCGDNRGDNLQAHHILSFSKYPELRFDISNGTTICKKCHSRLHPELKMMNLKVG